MAQTYDDYISTYVTDNNDVEYEVCFGLYHGSAHWDFWQDTGYEFVVDEEVELVYQEAINDEGINVTISKELLEKACDLAYEKYWENYASGDYN